MFKKVITLIMTLVLVLGVAIIPTYATAKAEELQSRGETDSGTCGDDLTWVFDDSTGTLTISGSGKMENYDYLDSAWWCSYESDIKNVIINQGVTSIGDYAFYDCNSLISITIPNSITSIGSSAFSDCTSLINITIHDRITNLGDRAFYNTAYYNNENNWDNGLLYIGNYLINAKSDITSANIKPGTIYIGQNAFWGCRNLISVTIPDSVTSIGEEAFYNCNNLKTVYNHSALNIVKGSTSYGYVAYYAYEVFEYNGNFNDNFTWVLDSDTGTLTISGSGAMEDYDYKNEAPWFLYRNCIKTVVINQGITSIGDRAFHHCESLTSITIPKSVERIGYLAFYGCSGLTSIMIPDSVMNIDDSAFHHCSSLISIKVDSNNRKYWSLDGVLFNKDKTILICCPGGKTGEYLIPDSVISTGDYAFGGCSKLTSITIPASVTGTVNTFEDCISLTKINVDSNNSNYSSLDGVLFNKDKTTLICCPGGKTGEYLIPASVTSIENVAFYNCSSLTSITIYGGVTIIGYWAFLDCSNLTSITIPDSVTSIGEDAFFACDNLTIYGYFGSYAQQYANENDIPFVCIASTPDNTATAYYSDGTNMNEGVQLAINEVTNAELPVTIAGDNTTAYDISITKDGKEITPVGDITVRMPLPDSNPQPKQHGRGEKVTVTNYEVYSVNGNKAELISSNVEGDYLVFTIKGFGRYAVKTVKTEINTDTDTKPTDSDTKPSDTDIKPTDTDSKPSDSDNKPSDTDSIITDTDKKLSDSDVKSSDTDTSTNSDDPIVIIDSEDTSTDTKPTDTENPTDSDVPGVFGDPDGDGKVTMKDVVLLQKYIAELVNLTDAQKLLADVNGDGVITMLDVTTMQKFIAELIKEFPAKAK